MQSLSCSQSRSLETQVDVPAQSDKAKEHNAPFDGNERERDNRRYGPELVSVENDFQRLVLHILPDCCWSLTFENAHDDNERSGVHL